MKIKYRYGAELYLLTFDFILGNIIPIFRSFMVEALALCESFEESPSHSRILPIMS